MPVWSDPWVQAALLFFATFAHEDVAILSGCYLVSHEGLPTMVGFGSLYVGVIVGDLAIYLLGSAAARFQPLRRLVERHVDADRRRWIEGNMVLAVAACRLLPSLLFPTFLACGFLALPLPRFARAVVVSATLYVPALFWLVVTLGDELGRRFGIYGWGAAVACYGGFVVYRRWMGRRVETEWLRQTGETIDVHQGMPALPATKVRVAAAERIPVKPYYVPLVLQWFWLAARYRSLTLPTVANPMIEAGGLLGESKIACLDMVAPGDAAWVARSTALTRSADADADDGERALHAMRLAGLDFPVVAKPDIGWRGIGVRRIDTLCELAAYLRDYPPGQRVILQEWVPYDGEAGVFYVRHPGRAHGVIHSLTLRYYPFVIGDGRTDLRHLILANPRTRWKAAELMACNAGRLDEVPPAGESVRLAVVGSSRVGGLYVDGRPWVTPAMTARIDAICAAMPEFHFGRFDVRFESIEAFQAGEGFKIIEVNGAGAEVIHMWDPDCSVLEGYRTLFEQQALMFAVADGNRARGFRPMTVMELVACQRRQQRLLGVYPASN